MRLVGFIKKKFVTMHGHINVKKHPFLLSDSNRRADCNAVRTGNLEAVVLISAIFILIISRWSKWNLNLFGDTVLAILTHCGRVTQICVFTLLLCKTDDANLRF